MNFGIYNYSQTIWIYPKFEISLSRGFQNKYLAKKNRNQKNDCDFRVETQGFEPWSEHGYCRAFYMFSQS